WPAMILTRGGLVRMESTGLPLGMFPEFDFSATHLRLEQGDMLFLYTDGLLEARRGDDEYGIERVTQVLRRKANGPPAEAISACLADLKSFVDRQPLDDLSLLAIQRTGQP